MADSDGPALRAAPTLTSLNEDILLHLFRFQTVKGQLSLMSTCHHLFDSGLSALLARPLRIRSRMLRLFHDFLSSFAPASFPALRNLVFMHISDAAELDTIADILKRATNLHVLFISCTTTEPMASDTIVEAIAALSNLRDLNVFNVNPDLNRSIAKRLQAPLVRLTLDDASGRNPLLPLLSNFCRTLEDVRLSCTKLIEVPFSCPKVTRLSLVHCSGIQLTMLVRVFPNLEALYVQSRDHVPDSLSQAEYDRLRGENATVQLPERWPSLACLVVDLPGLYRMGLRGETESIILLHALKDDNCDWLSASLQSLRPRHLQLTCREQTIGLTKALSVGMGRLARLDLEVQLIDSLTHGYIVSTVLHSGWPPG